MNSNTYTHIQIVDTGFLWERKLGMMEWNRGENVTFLRCYVFFVLHI